jgi:type II secretory pathway component PulC
MDTINPFTNTPTNAPVPNQPVKPGQPKIKIPFSIKPILKIIVLIIIGVLVAKLAFDSLKPKPETAPASAKKTIKPVVQKGTTAGKTKTGKSKTAEPVSLSETFAAAKQAAKQPASRTSDEPFALNGIFLSEADGMSSAIVNNKVVQLGDSVDGALVTAISIEGVELSKDGRKFTLRNK